MEAIKRIKKYKAKSPIDTINEIRNILHDKIGILLKEEHFKDDDSLFYSCRITVCNYGLKDLDIGCNGKGMSIEYALASAYGEFMERLQNNLMYMYQDFSKEKFLRHVKEKYTQFYQTLQEKNLILNYYYAPDESYTNSEKETIITLEKCSLPQDIISKLQSMKFALLPFYDVFNNTIEELPIELITHNCTSNGLCAGNTPEEALIQGISEILERYVIRLIYKNNFSLPSIPIEIFRDNKIYENIINLKQKYGWSIDIKDCSCQQNIPAIGVLIQDRKKLQHQFHIGVDPSPVTALERSLTEIYQGRTDVLFQNIDIPFQTQLLTDMELKESEMFKTYVDSQGIYPISILLNDESCEFKGFTYKAGLSDESDLTFLVELIRKMGFKLYIRDTSFLGFPSFHVYIPGMSEIKNVFSYNQFHRQFQKRRNYFLTAHNLKEASNEEIITLLNSFDWKDDTFTKFFNRKDAFLTTDFNLLKAILYNHVDLKNEALKHMKIFLQTSSEKFDDKSRLFFSCIKDILHLMLSQQNTNLLENIYPKSMLQEAVSFLNNKNNLDYFNLSSCFNCAECEIAASCVYFDYAKLIKKTEDMYIENVPDQEKLSHFFYKSPI
jgi:ribosomal protein S12 methylthiotransferase accessory factor